MPVVPTLALMAEVYELDRTGGTDSPRFRRYVELAAQHPIHPYNPMTGNPEALLTVEHLIGVDAESVVDGLCGDRAISIAVLTPGAWTDRAFTEIDYRTRAQPIVWFWAGEYTDPEVVSMRTRMQLARLAWQDHNGAPDTVRRLSGQEGAAMLAADRRPSGDVERARTVFEVVAEETDMGTFIAWLLGDEVAEAAGYAGLGLAAEDGLAFCVTDAGSASPA
ncbi:MAG: hypothetical protein ACFCVC_07795 [Acidimicrobiia bacterium]